MKRLLLASLLPALAAPAFAQASRTFERELPIQLHLDHSTFAYDDQKELIEIYVGFGGDKLPFRAAQDGGFEALVPVVLTLHAIDGTGLAGETAVWQDAAQLRFVVADTSEASRNRQFVQVSRAALPAGRYELRALVPAAAFGQSIDVRQAVTVEAAPDLGFSDVTLASTILRSTDRSDPFYHSGLSVQAHPSLVFGNTLPMVQYYTELYGMAAQADTSYTLRTSVVPEGGTTPVEGLTREVRRAARPTDVAVGSVNVRRLSSGRYTLRVEAVAPSGTVRAAQDRQFYVYNPGVAAVSGPVIVAFEASTFAAMPEADVTQYLGALDAISTEQERARMREASDLAAKRRYLYDFWTGRDSNPATPANEGFEEFERRLTLAESRYGRGRMVGYRTDRGRVLIKYGEPQEVQQSPMSRNNELRTFEVWSYEGVPGVGQAQFVFVDRRDTGNLEQVYSNVPGERSVTSWRCELSRLGQCDALNDMDLNF